MTRRYNATKGERTLAILRQASDDGKSIKVAAELASISLTTASIYAYKNRLNFADSRSVRYEIERHKTPSERALAMAALYRSGKTLREIGDGFSITRERVRQILLSTGIKASDGGQSKRAKIKRDFARLESEQFSLAERGCTKEQWRELLEIGREMVSRGIGIARTPTRAYCAQKQNAKRRGIGWEITLWQWWCIWRDSGKFEERRRGCGYVMCRKGDAGPYALGNVFVATGRENSSNQRRKTSGLPTGVQIRKRGNWERYVAQASIDGKLKCLGSFKSPDLAHAAYLTAIQAPTATTWEAR